MYRPRLHTESGNIDANIGFANMESGVVFKGSQFGAFLRSVYAVIENLKGFV